jgi:hypothetical protein
MRSRPGAFKRQRMEFGHGRMFRAIAADSDGEKNNRRIERFVIRL